jgi:putative peptidoglycan lipid II flippase
MPERPYTSRNAPPSIARVALRLLPLQVVFRGGEALLPLALAAWFGRSAATDLYYLLAAYFVFVGTILTAAFQDSGAIAVLVEVEARAPETLEHVLGSLFGHTLVVGAIVAVGLGLPAAVMAMATSHSPWLAAELTAAMTAGVMATSLRAFYVGVLNARGAFHAHPVASGAGIAVVWILLAGARHAMGVVAIPVALLVGELTAAGVLATWVRRAEGLRIVPSLLRPEPVRRIFSLVRLETTGALITRINPLVDQIMAGLARVAGGGTLLRYATDVAALPTSILQLTVFPVLLTRLAHESANRDRFVATTRGALGAVVGLAAAVSVLIIALRHPLCVLLFSHGAMDAAGVQRITSILPWALVGAAPFGALLVLARAHVALQNSRIMPGMGVLNSVLNAGLNAVFVTRWGLAGIALSTSVTYVVVALVFWWRLPKAVL